MLLNLKGSKLGQILHADKTGFRRLGHIISHTYMHVASLIYVTESAKTSLICT